MNLCVLGSGSRGNSIALWEGEVGLLVDLGLSYKQSVERMEARGIDPYMFGAALITHGHGDHKTSVRKWIENHSMQIWCTRPTRDAIEPLKLYPGVWREVRLRELFDVKGYHCYAVPSVHNADGAVTYIVEAPSGKQLALFVETGVVTPEMFRAGRHSNAYIVEANHDKEMCAVNFERPQHVNERVMLTHLNNVQAATLIEYLDSEAQVCVLVHLSSENNNSRLVDEMCSEANARRRYPIPQLAISTQDQPTEVYQV